MPTAKSALGIAALIPAVVEPPNAQDVGGSKGERSVRITVHGGKTFDSRQLQDGMRYNALTPGIGSLEGTGRGYYANPLAVQEVIVDLGTMGSAEYSLGGAQINGIPKTGGNMFTGSFFVAGTGNGLQSNNLDDDLIAQGLTSVNSVRKIYDFNATFGGPILRERLWFYAGARRWGTTTGVANLFADASVTDFGYTADAGRPIEPVESDRGIGVRLTYQGTPKDKFTFSWDKQRNFQDQLTGQLETGTTKNEANAGYCQRHEVIQGAWSRPQSNSLLFDAGVTVSKFNFGGFGEDLFLSDYQGCGGGLQDNVSINDTGLGFLYNGVGNRTMSLSHQSNGRFNVSMIKGEHTVKTGVFWMYGLGGGHRTYTTRAPTQVNGLPVSYTFLNGSPRSLTEFASPNYTVDQLNPDLGLYVQDQWRISRVTITGGVRFDWLRESVQAHRGPGRPAGAGPLVPGPHRRSELEGPQSQARHRVGSDGQREDRDQVRHQPLRPVEHDRPGTALRSGRRRRQQHDARVERPDVPGRRPAPRQLPARLRPRVDHGQRRVRRDGQPQLRHLRAGELAGSRVDHRLGQADYNWQTSVNVDRELTQNVVVNVGYFRTWYGNFMVTDNLKVTPADYSPYCVTAPVDPRLPLSGQQLCGLYDINPAAFGQVDNLITRNDNYGKQEEIYNGVDVNFQARVLGRGTLGGGWNVGNAVQLGTSPAAAPRREPTTAMSSIRRSSCSTARSMSRIRAG